MKGVHRMAFVNVNLQNVSGGTVAQLVNDGLARFKAARVRRTIYTQVLAELNTMTDRDLADIGISRLEIRDVARRAAYGKV